MYCMKCGNPIEETENVCKICGTVQDEISSVDEAPALDDASVDGNQAEEQSCEQPIEHMEFEWNIYDFPKPKKTEELDLKWSMEAAAERERIAAILDGESSVNHETSQSVSAVENAADKNIEVTAAVENPSLPLPQEDVQMKEREQGQGPKQEQSQEQGEEQGQEAEAAREQSVREIEKFFTFTKKNEAFQKLLDQEYEKINKRRDGEPYSEPDMSLLEGDFLAPSVFLDTDSELERMIWEGTTSADDAAPVEDLLHRRRTIPVDLDAIQKEARLAEALREKLDESLVKGEVPQEDKPPMEIPSIELQKKSVDDIVNEYQLSRETAEHLTAAAEEAVQEQKPEQDETAEEEALRQPEEQEQPEEPEEESVEGEACLPDDFIDSRLAELAAARESFLKQLEVEKEALRRAEEEASRREMRNNRAYEQAQTSRPRQPNPSIPPNPPETAVNQVFSGANAEIQVTVAVKANGGMPQQTISFVQPGSSPTPQPLAPRYRPPEENPYTRTRVIDAEAVKIVQAEKPKGEIREEPVQAEKNEPVKMSNSVFEEPWHENTLNSLFAVEQPLEEPHEPQEKRKGGRIGKIILAIIILILLVEILALGIKYFAPESAAAATVTHAEAKVAEVFSGAVDGISHFFKGLSGDVKDPASDESKNGTEPQENVGDDRNSQEQAEGSTKPQTPADPAPMADKTALIATQLYRNKNIKEIIASDTLHYVDGRTYKTKDISQSRPIEYNIWKTLSTGETLYYDQSVAGAVIAFDSQWQDYVNSGAKDVLSTTKEGSAAYNTVRKSTRVGRETQSFEKLELGEIRVSADGNSFYIWTKEQIKKTINGKTSIATYCWIYQVVPVGDEMKIADYIEHKED